MIPELCQLTPNNCHNRVPFCYPDATVAVPYPPATASGYYPDCPAIAISSNRKQIYIRLRFPISTPNITRELDNKVKLHTQQLLVRCGQKFPKSYTCGDTVLHSSMKNALIAIALTTKGTLLRFISGR